MGLSRALVAQQAYVTMLTQQEFFSRSEGEDLRVATLGNNFRKIFGDTMEVKDIRALKNLYLKMMDEDCSGHISREEFLKFSGDLECCRLEAIREVFTTDRKP